MFRTSAATCWMRTHTGPAGSAGHRGTAGRRGHTWTWRLALDRLGKFLGIGLNYTDHAEEMGMALPEHPILFLKATSSIAGANDDVVLPRGSVATDWEVELGVVIGTTAKYVTEEQALDHVAGYCVVNDVSERDYQTKLTGQWTKGKSCDTFGPIGPWLVTRDEVPAPQNLWLICDVNGERRQTGKHQQNGVHRGTDYIASEPADDAASRVM